MKKVCLHNIREYNQTLVNIANNKVLMDYFSKTL